MGRAYKNPTEDAAIGHIMWEEKKKRRREKQKRGREQKHRPACRVRVWKKEEREVKHCAGE